MSPDTLLPPPRIPIHTCKELFAKLEWDYQRLEENWGAYETFNFVVTAHHLYVDWIRRAGTKEQQQRKCLLPADGRKLFATLRDVTNASKHWTLNPDAQRKQIVASVSEPAIRDWHAYFIAGPVLYLSVDGALPSVPELASLTVQCLDWILNGKSNTFPAELAEGLRRIFTPLP